MVIEDLWFARELDSGVGQDGHQALNLRVEALPRVPDLADAQVPI
jgi:hypothetical protein